MSRIVDAVQVVIAAVAAWFVSLPGAFQALVFAMLFDIASGMLRAAKERQLNSDIAFVGMLKKSAIVIVVAMAAVIGHQLGLQVAGIQLPIGEATAIFFAIQESLSVLENAAALGVPIPDFLRQALRERAPDKFEGGKDVAAG